MHKPVMIVGEAWGEEEERQGKPFCGPSGGLLFGLMTQAGISRDDTYLTNVFNLRPRANNIDNLCTDKADALEGYRPLRTSPTKYVDKKYAPELARLHDEIERVRPNVIVALGNTALWALAKKVGVKKYRGSPLMSHDAMWKILPTWHPSAILRQWELRMIVLADLMKARAESAFPELRRPSHYIYMEPSLQDIADFWHKYLDATPYVSVDIETKGGQITEVGVGTADGKHAMVIPFWSREKTSGNYWPTLEDELTAWAWVRKILREKGSLGQNFQYDMQYFWRVAHMGCPKFIGDTMLLHHSLQPELEKGLGFLGSIYTNEPSWKFMRQDHSTMKREDD